MDCLSQSLSQSQSQSQMRERPKFGGGHASQIFDTPSFGFGFDFDFDWDFDWDNPIFLTQVSGLAIRISKGTFLEFRVQMYLHSNTMYYNTF